MNDDLSKEIEGALKKKTTEELLEIWQKNDREEWSDEAFDAIYRLLEERGEDIPEQAAPVQPDEEPAGVEPLIGWKKPLNALLAVIHLGMGLLFLWLMAGQGSFPILHAFIALGIGVNLVLRKNKWLTVGLCCLVILLNMDFSSGVPFTLLPGMGGMSFEMFVIILIEVLTIWIVISPNKAA